jgi:Tol biopolymer transport system component
MTKYMTRTATRTRFPTVFKTAAPSLTPTEDVLKSLGKIAFFHNNNLYTMRPDGSELTQVLALEEMALGVSWSPNGKRLVYGVGYQIAIANANGSGHYSITGKGDRNISSLDPDWSPDGAWIAYITDKSLRENPNSPFRFADLFLMRTDGTGARNLSPNQPIHSGNPDWSPDGQWIAFRYGDQIHITTPGGGTPRPLTTDAICENDNPSWSPDGTRIAFDHICGKRSQIYIMSVDEPKTMTAVTHATSTWGASHSTWSPDGQYIAYSLDGDVCIMGVEKKYSRCLTKGDEPDWSWATG